MQLYCESLTKYKRLPTREVKIGNLLLGNFHPVRIQTMTTTDTMDTAATVAQSIRCIEAGAELIRITAPSKNEAENLRNIKDELRKKGFETPLVADIHFTPNAAEIAARIVEKVRVNPGNYADKKKFEFITYDDAAYAAEIDRIRERFLPLIKICKEYGTAMRIGTNHGSLSDRIMSRYGDTPMGMVESAMEFLRIARDESYHQIVLSMKSSNPQVMVQAYRLLIHHMMDEFGECYPLHLGVTEAGDGEDGRIKSAIGIGTLLEDGIGDTIRVSLTEEPEYELPVCKNLIKRYNDIASGKSPDIPAVEKIPYDPFHYQRRETHAVNNIGEHQVPVVIGDAGHLSAIEIVDLADFGYQYDAGTDKWNISDAAADYIYCGDKTFDAEIPGTLKIITNYSCWKTQTDHNKYVPLFSTEEYLQANERSAVTNFVNINCFIKDEINLQDQLLPAIKNDPTVVLCLSASGNHAMTAVRRFCMLLLENKIQSPVIIKIAINNNADESLIHFAVEAGALLLDGFGDGLWLKSEQLAVGSRQINNIAFGILQATRTRISKTEYISCPSCGRTLFDLQETTAKIRAVTNHLKGVKIAIMGCIVNGPGEMADADFGYVGSGVGKITLYKGKDIMKRALPADVAVDELIQLIKEDGRWVEVP